MTTKVNVKVHGDVRTTVIVANADGEIRETRIIDGDLVSPEGEDFFLPIPPLTVFTVDETELTQAMKDERTGEPSGEAAPPFEAPKDEEPPAEEPVA